MSLRTPGGRFMWGLITVGGALLCAVLGLLRLRSHPDQTVILAVLAIVIALIGATLVGWDF